MNSLRTVVLDFFPSEKSLSYRNTLTEDAGFLFQLYVSTRTAELEAFGWDEKQGLTFLQMQFRAQQISYRQKYPDDKYQIILLGDFPIGAMLVSSQEREIHLVDIALLPEYRARGIGSCLIQNLLAEAELVEKPVRLEVKKTNRALQLYQRLGFREVRDDGIYLLMKWSNSNISKAMSKQ